MPNSYPNTKRMLIMNVFSLLIFHELSIKINCHSKCSSGILLCKWPGNWIAFFFGLRETAGWKRLERKYGIISDHLTHDKVSVHAYFNSILKHIKNLIRIKIWNVSINLQTAPLLNIKIECILKIWAHILNTFNWRLNIWPIDTERQMLKRHFMFRYGLGRATR